MRTTVCEGGEAGPRWIDVVGPSRIELLELAREFGLHSTSVADCLDPEHLPKHEKIGDVTFLILRTYDEDAGPEATDLQTMTRKVALFFRGDLVITIHRKDQPVLAALRQRYLDTPAEPPSLTAILSDAILTTLGTYDRPLEEVEQTLDRVEEEVFDPRGSLPPIREIHLVKRRVALIKRILWQSIGVIQKTVLPAERSQPYFQDLRESAEGSHFWADQLHEEAQNLLGVHLAMSSQRSNEVMRVLTVFAAFFLPLTFIVGVYGMNFERMPELRSPLGYPAVLLVMGILSLGIFLWFRRRGWIGGGEE